MIEILPLEDSWGMPLQVGSLYDKTICIHNIAIFGQTALHATYLSENAHAVGALAEEDLDPWAAEKAWIWNQAD